MLLPSILWYSNDHSNNKNNSYIYCIRCMICHSVLVSGMKKHIYFNQYICQGKLIAWQCFFEETLFKKSFDKEINQDDECLTRLALVTALTLAKAIFVNHRYAYLLQKIKLLQHSESQLMIWFVLTGHVCIPSQLYVWRKITVTRGMCFPLWLEQTANAHRQWYTALLMSSSSFGPSKPMAFRDFTNPTPLPLHQNIIKVKNIRTLNSTVNWDKLHFTTIRWEISLQ